MKNIPRIRVDDVQLIKILVCHIIYSLGCPLSRSQLVEITSLEQAVNYFDLIEALETIDDPLCNVIEVDGEPVYSNTRIGDEAARQFGNTLPASIREKMFEEAVKVYTRDAMKKNNLLSVRYAENENGTCTIGISIKSESTGGQKYYLNIYADNKQQAENIKNKVKNSPEELRKYLDTYFNN